MIKMLTFEIYISQSVIGVTDKLLRSVQSQSQHPDIQSSKQDSIQILFVYISLDNKSGVECRTNVDQNV